MRAPLPIDDVLPSLLEAVRDSPCVLLRAPTGAGKTTRVPLALFEAGLAGEGEIVVLQTRRLAARAAARRSASEYGCGVGERIGYQVRFDSRRGPRTRICFMTTGLFLRRLLDNPLLEGISLVIFDEFHERQLDGDLALAMARRVQQEVRDDLRLIVMSATLEPRGLQSFLGDAPLVESLGRSFPVEISYLDAAQRPARGELQATDIARVVHTAVQETDGDVLVFLPGVGEIRRLHSQLKDSCTRQGLALVELYGDLSPAEQDRALELRAERCVFLATNVAETSITLPRVTAVVDSGLMRTLMHDPAHGLNRLVLMPISRANAEQRSGRAGRTRAGRGYRLWTAQDQRSRAAQMLPEVRRTDCSAALLQLVAWGEGRPMEFPWFESPPDAALQSARQNLDQFGAIVTSAEGLCRLTAMGEQLVRMPLHPRLARLLLEGAALGVAPEAALAAALLSERSPFLRAGRREGNWSAALDSDLIDQVHGLQQWEETGQCRSAAGELRPSAVRGLLRIRDQLLRSLGRDAHAPGAPDRDEALARALLAAYPDRLARRREAGSGRALMMGGRGVRLASESNVRAAEFFLCLDVDGRSGEGLVRCASEVRLAWLPEDQQVRSEEVRFDPATARVKSFQTLRYHGLELDSRPGRLERNALSAEVLAGAAAEDLQQALDLQQPAYVALVARLSLMAQLQPEWSLPSLDDDWWARQLETLCQGKLSFGELRSAELAQVVSHALDWKQRQALERELPERLSVPSGNKIAIRYGLNKPPILAARIQELFGWKQTPRIASGRVPLLLHLLAPNMRPQQVTDDLESFWNTTYAQVRKDLRRRYPKHDWPEDPWTAVARKRRR